MKRSRTLMYDVASFVITKGQATVQDLMPQFPDFTDYQIRKALQNASAKGIIKCLHNGQQKGVCGCGNATYGPRDGKRIATAVVRKELRATTSVFDREGVTIPVTDGRVHSPLGGW